MNKVHRIFLFVILLLFPIVGKAQKFSVSTNIVDYINLGTINLEGALSTSRHISLTAGVRYNPFVFKSNTEKQFQSKRQEYSVGLRYWPWHIYSGWWVSAKMQYQEYNSGGIFSMQTQEGDRFGIGIGVGYTYMLTKHLNLDFGFKFWSGWDKYTKYEMPACGLTLSKGNKMFVLPDELIIGICYVF